MHVRLSPLAQADLADFKDYLEPRSPQGFNSVMTAIATTFDLLEKFPLIGRVGRVDGTRELAVAGTNYLIIYTVDEPYFIDVERVLHGKQKYPPDP